MNIVLVHGAYHGPWCWDLLRPELERSGHSVTAVDLPIGDRAAGADAYARAIIDAVDWVEPPVLVAHSMGGLVAPLVAAQRHVERLVFLAAFLPQPGLSANDQRKAEPIDPTVSPATAEWTDLGDDLWLVGPNTAREMFFHDASPELAKWAAEHLRPQAYRVINEVTPLANWPNVPCEYVVCRDDRAINPHWGRAAARARLGVQAAEIDGGHSPMLTRPAELARMLESLIAIRA